MKMLFAIVLAAATGQALAFDADPLTRSNRELETREAQKPAWKIKQEAEDREIKARSFDPSTAGRTAFIFAAGVEEITPRSSMIAILYRDTPCPLPIAAAKHFRSAESLYGRALVPACWGRLAAPTGDEVVVVTKYGDTRTESLINYAQVTIQPDGSGKFIKAAYSREEFARDVDAYHKTLR